jgi:MoxR-like ATPase
MTTSWQIFQGTNQRRAGGPPTLPPPPPWRHREVPTGAPLVVTELETDFQPFLADRETIQMVNAALLLRRPLLVTGSPGTGKTRLAYAVAHELNLGKVLHWPINTRSTRRDGLYAYDAVGRLQASAPNAGAAPAVTTTLGDYVTLGPLGTALLHWDRPRVVLVDEIDKSHVDLPNDLLHDFENGELDIPELARAPAAEQKARVPGRAGLVDIPGGTVRGQHFPLVIMTSNGEREFPAAFRRRCLELHIKAPDAARLGEIVQAHFGADPPDGWKQLCEDFFARRGDREALATDQLMNAVYLRACKVGDDAAWADILQRVWTPLSSG